MKSNLLPILCLTIPLLGLGACADEAPPGAEQTGEAQETASPAAREQGPDRPPEPESPATSSGASGIEFEFPESWQETPPSNTMRLAQATIPGPGGPAEIAVFHFGAGGGGGTEANLQRWIDQMQVSEGTEPERETVESDPFTIHLLTVEGTLQNDPMGMGPAAAQPDSLLLGAVVEGPGGPWFFKATGPKATLEPEEEAFREMVTGVEASG